MTAHHCDCSGRRRQAAERGGGGWVWQALGAQAGRLCCVRLGDQQVSRRHVDALQHMAVKSSRADVRAFSFLHGSLHLPMHGKGEGHNLLAVLHGNSCRAYYTHCPDLL